jgi:hypothetical protein
MVAVIDREALADWLDERDALEPEEEPEPDDLRHDPAEWVLTD